MASSSDTIEDTPPRSASRKVPSTGLSRLIARDRDVGQTLAQFIRQDHSSLNQLDAESWRVQAVNEAHKLVETLTNELAEERYRPLVCVLRGLLKQDTSDRETPQLAPLDKVLPTLDPKCVNTPHLQSRDKIVPRRLVPISKAHSIFGRLVLPDRVASCNAVKAVNKRFHAQCAACDIFRSRLVPTSSGFRVTPEMDKLCLLAHLKFSRSPGFKEINKWLALFRVKFDLKQVQAPGKKEVREIAKSPDHHEQILSLGGETTILSWCDEMDDQE